MRTNIFVIDYNSLKDGNFFNLINGIQQQDSIVDYYKKNVDDLFDYLDVLSKQPGFEYIDKGRYYLLSSDIRVTDTNQKHLIFNHFLKVIAFKKYKLVLIQKRPENEIILQTKENDSNKK